MISRLVRPRLLLILVAALMLGMLVSGTAFATSNASFTTFIPPLDYNFVATPDTNDAGGFDYIMLVCYNAAGEVLDTDNLYATATATPSNGTFFCDPYSMDGTPPADLTPAIWKMFDITSNVPENQLAQMGLIESSPLLACAGACTSGTTTTTDTGGILPILDGRLNAYDHGAPLAIYCTSGGYRVYDIDGTGKGTLDFEVSADVVAAALETAKSTGENVLIESSADNALWALAPGDKLQVMGAEILEPGKTYVFIFAPTCGTARTGDG